MKFIEKDNYGAFELVRYEEYLERELESLEALIQGASILTIDRFAPTGPGCFHDARLETFTTTTSQNGDESMSVLAELLFKGPYFDRFFRLRYRDVRRLVFGLPTPNDDLLMHELRREQDLIVHELHFDSGAVIEVVSGLLVFEEELT